jgi:cyanophycinase
MSIHLIGGGWDGEAASAVYGPFLAEAGDAPTVACLLIDEGDGAGYFARFEAALRGVDPSCAPEPVLVPVGGAFDPAVLEGADALLVGGGLTPAYHDALAGVLDTVTLRIMRGLPYAGFSAGASVAAEHAVVGGWLSGGIPVCPGDAAEDLEEVDVRPGLGLLPGAVEVHTAQWGTLSRLVDTVARGRARHGVALDENTLLTVEGDRARVSGRGRVHVVRTGHAAGEAVVRAYGAGEEFAL